MYNITLKIYIKCVILRQYITLNIGIYAQNRDAIYDITLKY